jgi:hypothetical protein
MVLGISALGAMVLCSLPTDPERQMRAKLPSPSRV